MNFQDAEKTYKDLKVQHDSGKLSDSTFEAEVGKLRMQDAQGRWWQIGVQTGEWYMHDGQKWNKAKPPVAATPPSEPAPSPEITAVIPRLGATPKAAATPKAEPAPKKNSGSGLPARSVFVQARRTHCGRRIVAQHPHRDYRRRGSGLYRSCCGRIPGCARTIGTCQSRHRNPNVSQSRPAYLAAANSAAQADGYAFAAADTGRDHDDCVAADRDGDARRGARDRDPNQKTCCRDNADDQRAARRLRLEVRNRSGEDRRRRWIAKTPSRIQDDAAQYDRWNADLLPNGSSASFNVLNRCHGRQRIHKLVSANRSSLMSMLARGQLK